MGWATSVCLSNEEANFFPLYLNVVKEFLGCVRFRWALMKRRKRWMKICWNEWKKMPVRLHGIMAALHGIPCFEVHVHRLHHIPSSSTLVCMIMAALDALLCFEVTHMFSNYKQGNANVTTGHICKGNDIWVKRSAIQVYGVNKRKGIAKHLGLKQI
jgi:hypothetical protein